MDVAPFLSERADVDPLRAKRRLDSGRAGASQRPELRGLRLVEIAERLYVPPGLRDQPTPEPDGADRMVDDPVPGLVDHAARRRRAPREHVAGETGHPSSSRSSGTARSTSPAPIVRTTSPGLARRARKRAPSSRSGVHATGIPGRASTTASTTSLPVTPSSGSSRGG